MLKSNWGTSLLICVLSLSSYAQVSGPQAVAGEYIVKFRKNAGGVAKGLKMVSKLGSSISVKAVMGASLMHVKVNSDAAKDALLSSPDVEFIEPNYLLSVNPTEVSPLGSPPSNSDEYVQSGADSKVRVTDSWAIQKPYDQGSKTVVAVIDTGLDSSHKLFADSGAIWTNSAEASGSPGVDDDGNGLVDDINGWNFAANSANNYDDNDHGTHVAGIILGVGQDIVAYPVRESKVKIMALKFLDANGSGSTSSAVRAIYYAVAKGAKVINNSWGGSSYSQSLHEAYTYAYNNGVVIVSAAGNSNSNNDSVAMYPSNLDTPNNISVAATDDSDRRASFSNYGVASVNVGAPGVRILSTVPGSGCIDPGCFQMMSGTSMATPFVAGMAALILREAPQLSAYQVRGVILGSIDTVSGLADKVATGGRVNVYKAIQNAVNSASTAAWSPTYEPDYKASRSPASAEAPGGAAAGCGLVKAIVDTTGGSGGGGAAGTAADIFLVLTVLFLPLIVALNLRAKQVVARVSMADRRVFQRFALAKQATLQIGDDQQVNITTADISLGGISFSSVTGLEKGQVIEVKFADGSQSVRAEVVRAGTNGVYGLKFLDVSDEVKFEIEAWTQGLAPTR
ncbi:MAG: in like serine protease [Pseudobdellovibrio sp.]|jgi:subtilisin family serine protease|nr:in like serine protease [Pseudobdellovibrio sp.]